MSGSISEKETHFGGSLSLKATSHLFYFFTLAKISHSVLIFGVKIFALKGKKKKHTHQKTHFFSFAKTGTYKEEGKIQTQWYKGQGLQRKYTFFTQETNLISMLSLLACD